MILQNLKKNFSHNKHYSYFVPNIILEEPSFHSVVLEIGHWLRNSMLIQSHRCFENSSD